jgi:hypothetical protein
VVIACAFIGLIFSAAYAAKGYKSFFQQKSVYENNLMKQAYETDMKNKQKQMEIEKRALEEERREKKN